MSAPSHDELLQIPNLLADAFRPHRYQVKLVPNWQVNGRPGGFAPEAGLTHWDASPKGVSPTELAVIVKGAHGVPGPLAGLWGTVDDGIPTTYVCSIGRANHGGLGRAIGPIARDSANRDSLGWELDWTVDEAPLPGLIEMSIVGWAALCSAFGWVDGHGTPYVFAHSEYAPDRKIDVTGGSHGLDMPKYRRQIAAQLAPPKPHPKPVPSPGGEVEITDQVPITAAVAKAEFPKADSISVGGLLQYAAAYGKAGARDAAVARALAEAQARQGGSLNEETIAQIATSTVDEFNASTQ